LDDSSPLVTWTLSAFIPTKDKEKDKKVQINSPVSLVKWCPQRPAAFFAFTAGGFCFFFDLQEKVFEPIYVEFVGVKNSKNGKNGKNGQGDVSQCRPGGKTVYIATNSFTKNKSDNNGIDVTIRTLSEDLLQNVRGVSEIEIATGKEENKFRKTMAKWAARVSEPQITILLKKSSLENGRK
jgi:hypothetical protein